MSTTKAVCKVITGSMAIGYAAVAAVLAVHVLRHPEIYDGKKVDPDTDREKELELNDTSEADEEITEHNLNEIIEEVKNFPDVPEELEEQINKSIDEEALNKRLDHIMEVINTPDTDDSEDE